MKISIFQGTLSTHLCVLYRNSRHNLEKWAQLLKKQNKTDLVQNLQFALFVSVWAQSHLTLCDPMDYSPPGSSVHGILQARILEWVASSYSRRSTWPRDETHFSCVSCLGRWILLPVRHRGSPIKCIIQDHVVIGWLRTTMSWLCVYLFC